MAAQSLLAKLGIRLGTLGTAASLAAAFPLSEGDPSMAAHTAASRIGLYADRTGGAEKMGHVVLGTEVFSVGVSAVTAAVKLQTVASTTAAAGLNLPQGAAPTSPVNGDVWITSAGMFARANGVTAGPFSAGGGSLGGTIASTQIAVGSGSNTISGSSSLTFTGGTLSVTGGITTTGTITTPASTTSASSLNIPQGAAPSAPVNGDIWTTSAGLFVRIAGGTVGPLGTGGGGGSIGGSIASTQIAVGSGSNTISGSSSLTFTGGILALTGGMTATSTITTVASAAGGAGFNLPQGAAPTSPVNGDLWTTSAGLFVQIAGSTIPLKGITLANTQVAYATSTNVLGGSANMTYTAGRNSANALILAGDASLEVHNNTTGQYMQFTASAAAGNWLQFSPNSTPTVGVSIGNNVPGTAAGNNMYLCTYNGAWAARVVLVNSTGNLLVGTTTDDGSNKLQVAGTMAVSGLANIGGVVLVNGATADGVHALVVNGAILTDASQTTRASLQMPPGSAPVAPVNGDVWNTSAGMFTRASGVTVGPFIGISAFPYAAGSNAQIDLSATLASVTYGGINIVAKTSQANPTEAFGMNVQLNYPTGAGLTTGCGIFIGTMTGSTSVSVNTGIAITSPSLVGGGNSAAALSIGATPKSYTGQFTIISTDIRPSHFTGTLETEAGLKVKEGSNLTMGKATLSGGTVTVSTTKVTANSRIFVNGNDLGTITVPVGYAVSARVPGTSFTILSASAIDTSDVAWIIIEPSP